MWKAREMTGEKRVEDVEGKGDDRGEKSRREEKKLRREERRKVVQNRKARTRPKDERTGVRTTKSDMTGHKRTGQGKTRQDKTGRNCFITLT